MRSRRGMKNKRKGGGQQEEARSWEARLSKKGMAMASHHGVEASAHAIEVTDAAAAAAVTAPARQVEERIRQGSMRVE
jgi:hypothetical protein